MVVAFFCITLTLLHGTCSILLVKLLQIPSKYCAPVAE